MENSHTQKLSCTSFHKRNKKYFCASEAEICQIFPTSIPILFVIVKLIDNENFTIHLEFQLELLLLISQIMHRELYLPIKIDNTIHVYSYYHDI